MVQHRTHEEDHLWHLDRVSVVVITVAARDGESLNIRLYDLRRKSITGPLAFNNIT